MKGGRDDDNKTIIDYSYLYCSAPYFILFYFILILEVRCGQARRPGIGT